MLFCKLKIVCLWVEQLAWGCKACHIRRNALVPAIRGVCDLFNFFRHTVTMTTCLWLIVLLLILNILTFCVFWWDKTAARGGKWRVSENDLLSLALFGGSLGAWAAQKFLRHKTRKEPFRTRLTAILVLHAAILSVGLLALPWVLAGHVFNS